MGFRFPVLIMSSSSSQWNWTADICISSDPEAKQVCFRPLHDAAEVLLEEFMTPDLSLTFQKFINLEDLIFVLPASTCGVQLLEVRPKSGMTDLHTFATYMVNRGLVSELFEPI